MTPEPRTSPRPGGYDQAIRGNRWHQFLYLLMRDELAAGIVERIVCEVEDCGREPAAKLEGELTGPVPVAFSNDFLAAYAIELNGRLQGQTRERALELAHAAIRHAQGYERT